MYAMILKPKDAKVSCRVNSQEKSLLQIEFEGDEDREQLTLSLDLTAVRGLEEALAKRENLFNEKRFDRSVTGRYEATLVFMETYLHVHAHLVEGKLVEWKATHETSDVTDLLMGLNPRLLGEFKKSLFVALGFLIKTEDTPLETKI